MPQLPDPPDLDDLADLADPPGLPHGVDPLDLPHAEARRVLSSGAPVFVPVNPVEFHGPHLSLHNDSHISLGLVRDLHARLARPEWPLLCTRDLEVGVEPVPGPGSRPVPYTVVRALVRQTCATLADLGARRVVLITFHGSPMHEHALQAGVDLLTRRGVPAVAPLNALLAEMLTLDPQAYAAAADHIADPAERSAVVEALRHDFHAGFFETSLALHYAPRSVHPRYKTLPPCPTPKPIAAFLAASRAARAMGAGRLSDELAYLAHGAGWFGVRPFLGYTSHPAHATAEAGAWFAERLTEQFAPLIQDVLDGRIPSPPPIVPWLPLISLAGRVGNMTVPAKVIRTAIE